MTHSLIERLEKALGPLPPRPWRVYHAPLRPQLSKTKIIEIHDRDGNAVIPWSGFDDINVKNRLGIARHIVKLINAEAEILCALRARAALEDKEANMQDYQQRIIDEEKSLREACASVDRSA